MASLSPSTHANQLFGKGPQTPSTHKSLSLYLDLGWPVFPLNPRSKTPRTRSGFLDANTHPQVVNAWWNQNPDYNIGLASGIAFDVLDIDGEEGRLSLVKYLPDSYDHPGPIASTGTGGWHLYFLPTGEGSRQGALPKLDYRGRGGYVVAPPSIHPNGITYEWLPGHGPTTALPEAPDWLRRLLKEKHAFQPTRPLDLTKTYINEDAITVAQELGIHVSRALKAICPFHDQTNGNRSLQFYSDGHFFCHSPRCGAHGWGQQLRSGKPLKGL